MSLTINNVNAGSKTTEIGFKSYFNSAKIQSAGLRIIRQKVWPKLLNWQIQVTLKQNVGYVTMCTLHRYFPSNDQ